MYPEIDEAIMNCLLNPVAVIGDTDVLTSSILSNFTPLYFKDYDGPQEKTIFIAHAGDMLRADDENFDGSPRLELHVLVISVPDEPYITALKATRDAVQAIKNELERNPTFTDWAQWMKLGDVRPAYDDRGRWKEEQMQLQFNIDEDYYFDDDQIANEIRVRGELE